MKYVYAAAVAVIAGSVAGYLWPADADVPLPMDNPVSLGGIETVCTGIGEDSQHDPRWLAYPVRIEFANGAAQYVSGAHVVLTAAGGKPLASLDCSGAWVLFKLGPGTYQVTATHQGEAGAATRSATFSPPATGQKRIILDFAGKSGG